MEFWLGDVHLVIEDGVCGMHIRHKFSISYAFFHLKKIL